MQQISNKVGRKSIEDYFRKVAKDHNEKHFPVKLEDIVDKDDEGKRILYIMPGSSKDVFMSTSLFKSIKEKYPKYNLYVATKPENFSLLWANEFVHKTIPYSESFEISVSEARREIPNRWRSFFRSKDYAPHEREDIVSADIMRYMRTEWGRWNDIQDGLGNLWIMKFMTPQPDATIATYHQGNWLPGFSNINRETKFITLGLKFLSTNPEVLDIPMAKKIGNQAGLTGRQTDLLMDKRQVLITELAESFTDKMRALYNQESPRQNDINMTGQERLNKALGGNDIGSSIYATSESIISGSTKGDFIKEATDVYKAIDKGELETIQQLNPDMKLLYGVTGDIALDYLSLRGAPGKFDKLLDIRNMAQFYFMPNKVLNNRGKLENVNNLRDYYGHVKREAKIYFGEMADKNLLVKDKISSIDMNPTGKAGLDRNVETSEQAKQEFRNNIMDC